MRLVRAFTLIIILSATAVSLVRCDSHSMKEGGGGGGGGGNGSVGGGIRSAISNARPFAGSYCRVSDVLSVSRQSNTRNRVLFIRGGGWENAEQLQFFLNYVNGGKIAVVLSATTRSSAQQVFNYYASLMSAQLVPIYTESPAEANDSEIVRKLEGAGGILITGGQPARLRHLLGTRLGVAIQSAHAHGIPVHTNSASTALVGSHFGWNLREAIDNGLFLLPVTFLSHLEDPQKYGQYPSDLWHLIDERINEQSFGLTAGTTAEILDGELTVRGDGGTKEMVLVYDSQLGRTDFCKYWVLLPGESYRLR